MKPYSKLFISLFVFWLIGQGKAIAQLDSIIVNYKLDSIKFIDLKFGEFPEKTSFIKVKILDFSSDKFDNYQPYRLYHNDPLFSFKPSSSVRLKDVNRIEFSSYLLFYIQYYSSDSLKISEQYYRHKNAKNRAIITVDVDPVILKNKNETHSFIWSWESGKDLYWRFYLDKSFETAVMLNLGEIPAYQLHWVTSDKSFDSIPFYAELLDKEGIGSESVFKIPKKQLSFSINHSDTVKISHQSLSKPCDFLFRIVPVNEVPISEIFDHPKIQALKYVNQKDTLINGSLLRKIDFEIHSSLDSISARLKSNQYLLGWYMQNGIYAHKVKVNSGITKFSLVYPTRYHGENMKTLRVQLTDGSFTPFKPSINIPYLPANLEEFEFLKISRGSSRKKFRLYQWSVFIGKHDSIAKNGFNDFESGLHFGCENHDPENSDLSPQINVHKSEYLTFVITDKRTKEILKTLVLPVTSERLNKRKIVLKINDDLKLKFKIERVPYLVPKFDIDHRTFSDFRTDMSSAMDIPTLYRNSAVSYLNKTRDIYLTPRY